MQIAKEQKLLSLVSLVVSLTILTISAMNMYLAKCGHNGSNSLRRLGRL